jgi:hypothetical protein
MMGNKPYPAEPTGVDLRQNREELLAHLHLTQKPKEKKEPKTDTKTATD